MVHSTPDGGEDLTLPDNVRFYFLTGTQHVPGAFRPRPAIEERYASRQDFLTRIETAGQELIGRRYLLEGDLSRILERAAQHWNLIMSAQ